MASRTNPTLPLALATLVLGLGALAIWWVVAGTDNLAATASATTAPQPAAPTPAPPVSAPVVDDRAPSAAADPVSDATQTPEQRAAVASAAEKELEGALWVEGRVRFPDDTPLGETVEVIASGKKFEHRELHRATVGANGAFRVAFAKGTRTGQLKLDAPHLYLDPPLRLRLDKLPDAIELEPALGGCIAGAIVPPLGVSDAAGVLEDVTVTLSGWSSSGGGLVNRSSKLDGQLRFELRGIPPGATCSLDCDPVQWVPAGREDLEVTKGETLPLDLHFTLGARVSGRIVDEAGAALAQVQLGARCEGADGSTDWRRGRAGKVAADGSFSLAGISPGTVTLSATKQGYLPAEHPLGALVDGQVKEGLEVRMSSGHFVAGRVAWPDGRPAVGARVSVESKDDDESQDFAMGDRYGIKTDGDGAFRISGLGAGPFDVTALDVVAVERKSVFADADAADADAAGAVAAGADAPNADAAEANSDAAPAQASAPKKLTKKGPRWRVRVEGVKADEAELALVLQPGFALAGRVEDDSGAPIERFVVTAKSGSSSWWNPTGDGTVSGRFQDKEGHFVLEGLDEGEWSVVARAFDHTECEAQTVRVPADAQALKLVLARVATVTGLVLDPAGEPASKANVQVSLETSHEGYSSGGGDRTAKTGRDGRFKLSNVPSGALVLTAERDGDARSEALHAQVAAAGVLSDVTLRLRRGGRLTGEVLAGAGGPIAGREVSVNTFGDDSRSTRTDAAGHFEFDALTPGSGAVTLEPNEEEVRKLRDTDGERDWSALMSLRRTAQVTIVDNGSVHVVLGAPPRAPVLVSGSVRRGAAAVAGAEINAWRLSATGEHQQKRATTDSEGRYQFTLDEPGAYSFNLSSTSGGTQRSRRETIPAVAAYTLDFELPSGSISGRVLGPDGAPVEGANVSLAITRESAEKRSEGVHGSLDTESDGSFRFEDLPAATYAVSVRDQPNWRGSKPTTRFGTVRRAGLELAEGAALTGIELRFELAGVITGVVVDAAGEPAVGTHVTVRDSSGALEEPFWFETPTTDGAGRYRIGGLAPGTWTVSARREREVSDESAPVHVSAGGEVRVDLALGPGTLLHIVVEDADGKEVGAALSVRDARGREYGDSTAYSDFDGLDDGPGRRVGPLPSGNYTVTATNHDGVRAEQSVHVSGEAERTLRLKLGGE